LGVGSGASREEFELLGLDYDQRFRVFRDALETMRKVWRGEPLAHGTLPILPGCERRAADADRRVAQPALDHPCR
jgi:alkanesulfonate monooxygenase SsuD/methylene tetrahydromethanopterin reductase-like flavin-dependent oxidoreductase (luciferase family)